jgi:hypothetical protein
VADLVASLEESARRRFVRWDPALWARVLDGPARRLAASLREGGTKDEAAERTVESYLRLACEAIGLGYLFPPEVGEGFLNHAFFRLIPEGLARVPAERRARALADCWNLGENLEHAPSWWRLIFVRLVAQGASLEGLDALVARVEREALAPPELCLGTRGAHTFVDLGAEDRRFLPGSLHFLAPTVLCVHDRAATQPPRTLGAWLVDPPLVLGPMACAAEVGPSSDRLDLVDDLGRQDPRAGDVLNSAANDWRAALTLETSQMVVALYPLAEAGVAERKPRRGRA